MKRPIVKEHVGKVAPPYTYWVIEDQFLAGGYPSDFLADRGGKPLTSLLDAGIRTFIDLREEEETDPATDRPSSYHAILKKLADFRHVEFSCIRIPIADLGIPSMWTMRLILDSIDSSLKDRQPVYVHCFGGLGRTGTVVGCFLMRHGIADESNVLDKIRELRHRTELGKEPSPHTPQQIQMVVNWKRFA
jgi:hypothetical protein